MRIDARQPGQGAGSENGPSSIRSWHTMDLPTQTHLKTLRGLLDFRLAELRADVHAARRGHAAEADHERDERVEMKEVEAALHRLDAGVYGDCSDCGEPIALQRLLVQPATRRCAWCQARYDADEEDAAA